MRGIIPIYDGKEGIQLTLNEKAIQIKAALAAAVSFGTALFGWIGWVIVLWICAMLLDYVTGTLAAVSKGEWSSRIARSGLWHKAGSIAAVLVAALCDIALGVIADKLGIYLPDVKTCILTPAVAMWYIFTELGSVIENAAELGAPMPEFLKKRILSLRDAAEEGQEQ